VTHIKAAHPILGEINAAKAAAPGFLTMAVGGLLALASGSPEVLMAGLSSGSNIIQRGVLRYSRDQEKAADAGAITLLQRLKWPVTGLEQFLTKIHQKFSKEGVDPYLQSHPLTQDRIVALAQFIKQHQQQPPFPNELKMIYDRMRAKIIGFVESPQKVLRIFPASDQSVSAQYARLIAYYRLQKYNEFEKIATALLKSHPDDSYFLELIGQFTFERGNPEKALTYFEKARQKRKNTQGLDVLYAHILIHLEKKLGVAVEILTPLVQKNPENIWAWRLLATAYGKMNQPLNAAVCLAEEAYLKNDLKSAKSFALRGRNAPNKSLKDRAETLLGLLKEEG